MKDSVSKIEDDPYRNKRIQLMRNKDHEDFIKNSETKRLTLRKEKINRFFDEKRSDQIKKNQDTAHLIQNFNESIKQSEIDFADLTQAMRITIDIESVFSNWATAEFSNINYIYDYVLKMLLFQMNLTKSDTHFDITNIKIVNSALYLKLLESLNVLVMIANSPLRDVLVSDFEAIREILEFTLPSNENQIVSISTTLLGNICATENVGLKIYRPIVNNLASVLQMPREYIPVNDALFFLSATVRNEFITDRQFLDTITVLFGCLENDKKAYSLAVDTFVTFLHDKREFISNFDNGIVKILNHILNFLYSNIVRQSKEILLPCFKLVKLFIFCSDEQITYNFLKKVPLFKMFAMLMKIPRLTEDVLVEILVVINTVLKKQVFQNFSKDVSLKDLSEVIDVKNKIEIRKEIVGIYLNLYRDPDQTMAENLQKHVLNSQMLELLFKILQEETEKGKGLNLELTDNILVLLQKVVEASAGIKQNQAFIRKIEDLNFEYDVEKVLTNLSYHTKNPKLEEKTDSLIAFFSEIIIKYEQ